MRTEHDEIPVTVRVSTRMCARVCVVVVVAVLSAYMNMCLTAEDGGASRRQHAQRIVMIAVE